MTYNVVKIMNDTEILIDYGAIDGAVVNQKVRIFEPGEEIFDIKGNSLGYLDKIKIDLSIVAVYAEMSVCKDKVTQQKNILAPTLEKLTFTSTTYEKLNVDTSQISKTTYISEKPIVIGDKVDIIDK